MRGRCAIDPTAHLCSGCVTLSHRAEQLVKVRHGQEVTDASTVEGVQLLVQADLLTEQRGAEVLAP